MTPERPDQRTGAAAALCGGPRSSPGRPIRLWHPRRAAQPPLPSSVLLRSDTGEILGGNGVPWSGPATAEDELILDRAVGPILDIGCGPGRHVLALARRGETVLGLDVTPAAVHLARTRGANVVEGCIFGPVPATGTWATALLLDGNIGIDGHPARLLARVGAVLRPGGRILVELSPPGTRCPATRVRLEYGTARGPWFAWSTVQASAIGDIANRAGLTLIDCAPIGGRVLARIDAPAGEAAPPGPHEKVR